jgi:hypothetical protein
MSTPPIVLAIPTPIAMGNLGREMIFAETGQSLDDVRAREISALGPLVDIGNWTGYWDHAWVSGPSEGARERVWADVVWTMHALFPQPGWVLRSTSQYTAAELLSTRILQYARAERDLGGMQAGFVLYVPFNVSKTGGLVEVRRAGPSDFNDEWAHCPPSILWTTNRDTITNWNFFSRDPSDYVGVMVTSESHPPTGWGMEGRDIFQLDTLFVPALHRNDTSRSMTFPYDHLAPESRRYLATLFAGRRGSSNPSRSATIDEMLECANRSSSAFPAHRRCIVLDGDAIFKKSLLGTPAPALAYAAYALSVFAVHPLGDTPKRRALYDSILMGAVPVMEEGAAYQFPLESLFPIRSAILFVPSRVFRTNLTATLEAVPPSVVSMHRQFGRRVARAIQIRDETPRGLRYADVLAHTGLGDHLDYLLQSIADYAAALYRSADS